MNILDKIAASTRLRVEKDKAACPPEALAEKLPVNTPPLVFESALARPGMSFICEVKKASPSKGVIAEDFPYLDIARDYEAAGADALSILTEPDYFQGRDEFLTHIRREVELPLLRKDFVVDEYQILQARALGAAGVLLICALLAPAELAAFLELADGLGLSALVEAHDEGEVAMALSCGAKIIGVNNRDLRTFQVDTGNSVRLRGLVPPGVLFVSESGITAREDVALLEENGVDAVLIGETLMRSPDKKQTLNRLRGG